jgi:ribosomal protein L25 (general stress protein Ctc)
MTNLLEEQQIAIKARKSEQRSASEKLKALGKPRALTYHHNTKVNEVNLGLLGAALGRQWRTNPEFEQFKAKFAQDESSILTLDIEFSQVLRKVFEVALGQLKSGKVLIDNRTRHDCTDTELLTLPNGQTMGFTTPSILLGTLKNIYGKLVIATEENV